MVSRRPHAAFTPETPMTRAWIATAPNFFFPGAGYLVRGHRPALAGASLVGVLGRTWVETSLQAAASHLYWPMFASVFVMNAAFAVDVWRLGRARAVTA